MSASTGILKTLLNKIGKSKVKDPKYKSYTFDILQEAKDGALSIIGLFIVDFRLVLSDSNECEKSTWIIKLKNTIANGFLNNDKLYANEHLFYNEVAPILLDKYQCLFPRYVYSQANGDEYDCVILEKMEEYGASIYPLFYLPENHIEKMIETVAKFHAATYILKETDRKKFDEIVTKIQKLPSSAKNTDGQFIAVATVIQAACKNVEDNCLDYDRAFVEDVRRNFQWPNIKAYYDKLTQPTEPMSTIIHGDYNKYNVLFNYNENENLQDLKMIDYQIMTYASPAVDLAFVLFMNANLEQRSVRMDEYLDLYYTTISKEFQDFSGLKMDLTKYSRENFLNDFKTNMWQGFGIAMVFKVEQSYPSMARIDDIFLQPHSLEYVRDAVESELMTDEMRSVVGRDLEFAVNFVGGKCAKIREE